MKKFAVVIPFLLLVSSFAGAESLRPEEVVKTLVIAARQNDLKGVLNTADLVKIAQQKRHGRSPKDLVKFLNKIDPKKLKFQDIRRKGWPKTSIVRITAPISMDFDLELVKATKEKQEDHYRVVAVHP
jgi:hypothetical protein